MDKFFLSVLNMSLTASFVIAAVLLARLFLRRAPKVISYALWAVVLFNLLCPFKPESVFSLIPSSMPEITAPERNYNYPTVGGAEWDVAGSIPAEIPSEVRDTIVNTYVTPMRTVYDVLAVIWLAGVAAMLLYGVASFFILKRKMRNAAHIEANIYETENIKSPFVLGVFRPRIYLPVGLSEHERGYILLHERTHIRRRDHIVKFAAYVVLCLH
jgi:beta-lactamase regulating signal transducer with metallopeptidase domain